MSLVCIIQDYHYSIWASFITAFLITFKIQVQLQIVFTLSLSYLFLLINFFLSSSIFLVSSLIYQVYLSFPLIKVTQSAAIFRQLQTRLLLLSSLKSALLVLILTLQSSLQLRALAFLFYIPSIYLIQKLYITSFYTYLIYLFYKSLLIINPFRF